jgi:hypothetical protein
MDPRYPEYNENQFSPNSDWHDFYRDANYQMTPPHPSRGKMVSMQCFVDADHASNRVTRSQTGIVIFLNRAPIVWYSKRQNAVESSTFGSKFIVMKSAVEMLQALGYKLQSFGIPIDGPILVTMNLSSIQARNQKQL